MFYAPDLFELSSVLEQGWSDIRREYESLDRTILEVHRNGTHADFIERRRQHGAGSSGWAPSWQAGSSQKNYQWLTYGLCYRGRFPAEAEQQFPLTQALLGRFPYIEVAAFSMMTPLSCIAPHTHPRLGGKILTYHLGIEVAPRSSYLCVDGVFREEQPGKSLVFDGSAEHFAVNVGRQDRTILYLEFDQSQARPPPDCRRAEERDCWRNET